MIYLIDIEKPHSVSWYFHHALQFGFQFENCSIYIYRSYLKAQIACVKKNVSTVMECPDIKIFYT